MVFERLWYRCVTWSVTGGDRSVLSGLGPAVVEVY